MCSGSQGLAVNTLLDFKRVTLSTVEGVVRRTVICRENGFYVVQSYLSLSVFFDVNRHMMLSILCTALCG